jgi:CRP/FNR family cyclic AMP-dependent transcriptional regulator
MRIHCNASTVRNLPFFSTLTDAELREVLQGVQHRTYPPRSLIVRSGDVADGLGFVLSGCVHVLLGNGHGREVIVAVLGPNDFFGESGLLQGGPRLEDVQSHTACDILYVPRKTLLDCLQRNPAAAMFFGRALADRLAAAHLKIGSLAFADVYCRVAHVLLENSREQGNEWLVEPGSELIASMVGASREMVSRVVKNMIEHGIARRYKRKLIIVDRGALVHRVTGGTSPRGSENKDLIGRSPRPAVQPLT